MAIVPFPTDVLIENVSISHDQPAFVTTALNRSSQTRPRGIHQLKGSFDMVASGLIAQKALEAFFVMLEGRANEFELQLPSRFTSEFPDLGNNPTVTTSAPVGTTSFPITGIGTDTIYAGSFFNMPNPTELGKTYVVTNTVTNGGTINFKPAIRVAENLPNFQIEMIAPKVTCRLTGDITEFQYDEQGLITRYSLEFEEVL